MPRSTRIDDHAPTRPKTLVEVFQDTVRRHPHRLALEAPDGAYTYQELSAEVANVADALRAVGLGPGDRIGVRVASGTAQLYLAILAVLHCGAAYVPVDAADPGERAEWIWQESGVAAVLGDGLAVTRLDSIPGRPEDAGAGPWDDAWVIFTSGSTGRPKGVAVHHAAAAAFVEAETRLWTVRPEDRVLAGLSVGFDASCEEMWLAWRNGAALVPAPRDVVRAGTELGPWLARHRISVVSTVPSLAATWDEADLAGVRVLILGGEVCPPELGWKWAARCEVWNTYGPTEATVVTTAARIRPGVPVTIGVPLDGWCAAVLDEGGAPVPDGMPGELVIGGVGLARYLDPVLDAQRYRAEPALGWARAYHTGDMARRTELGFEFIGRRDSQVKINGRRVDLTEIESELRMAPRVRAAAAAVRTSPAGMPVLAGYFVADSEPDFGAIRSHLAKYLPEGVRPVLVPLPRLPLAASGKVDRQALPWPPPDGAAQESFTGTAAWLAQLWTAQLGVAPRGLDEDFFDLGGSSLAAARLATELRTRFPGVAVADIYIHRTLGGLAEYVDRIRDADGPAHAESEHQGELADSPQRRKQALDRRHAHPARHGGAVGELAGVLALLAFAAPVWLLTVLGYNDWTGVPGLPRVPWPWLVALWLVSVSTPGRVALVCLTARLLLRDLRPGRYPRRSWLALRVWFVDRLAETMHLDQHGGTPWAARVARLAGLRVGDGARLGVIPSPAALVRIGPGATLEADADVRGWWVESSHLVVGTVRIGAGARIGARAVLMPGASVGDGAEVEAGSVVTGHVPASERWSGSPARYTCRAGEDWPDRLAPQPRRPCLLRLCYAAGGLLPTALLWTAVAAAIAALLPFNVEWTSFAGLTRDLLLAAPLLTLVFVLVYATGAALLLRALGRMLRPGWHGPGLTSWAGWTRETILAGTRTTLFPLYSSIYTRPWLRLAGIDVGRRTEVSTAVGLTPLVRLGHTAFVADDVVFNTARSRAGWTRLDPIEVGQEVFLGNGALVNGATRLPARSLVGVQSTPPPDARPGTTWFGVPALEFPRPAVAHDTARTITPPRRLVLARALVDLARIILPLAASSMIADGLDISLEEIGRAWGTAATLALCPLALAGAGIAALAITVAAKWAVIGRYRAGEHPLWSWFVWRDEILNTCQEVLAGAWLLDTALGSAVMNVYLRAMGSRVAKDAWINTLTITEFDLVTLGPGCALNRRSCIETHLFHDRMMSLGPITLGAHATVGPASAVLPDTVLGEWCSVGARSVVLRGEQLPPHSDWHGAPIAPA
jgi:non-ribosomal peptide synthetase-like protein